jgi:polar amino acid transport system permease protein
MTIYAMVFLLYLAVGYPAIRFVTYLEKRMKNGYAVNKASKRKVGVAQ